MSPASSGTHPFRVRTRGLVSVAGLTAALVVAFAFPLAQSAPSDAPPTSPTRCEQVSAAAAERAGMVSGRGDTVLVVGDSWSGGWKLRDLSRSWPSRLPGRVFVDGFPGSGYSAAASPCGPVSYGDRVAAAVQRSAPDLVVLQGGLNDYDRPAGEIREGFERVLAGLEEHDVVVVGPAAAPSRAHAVPRVDRLLASLSARHGVAYVRTTDLELPYLPDRLHLTRRGHQEFGDAVAERIAALD